MLVANCHGRRETAYCGGLAWCLEVGQVAVAWTHVLQPDRIVEVVYETGVSPMSEPLQERRTDQGRFAIEEDRVIFGSVPDPLDASNPGATHQPCLGEIATRLIERTSELMPCKALEVHIDARFTQVRCPLLDAISLTRCNTQGVGNDRQHAETAGECQRSNPLRGVADGGQR